jgi:hypothetical protein
MNTAVLSRSVSRRLAAQVDTLGALNAQIAELQGQAELIKAELKSTGLDTIEGVIFKCVIAVVEQARLDSSKVKALLTPAQIAACTRVTESVRLTVFDR